MQTLSIIINADEGLHARPAHLFCAEAKKYQSYIQIRNQTTASSPVNAQSILLVLTLGVQRGHQVQITCEGVDEELACEALRKLIQDDFPA